MNNSFKFFKQALEARGFYIRKVDDYVFSLNGKRYDFETLLKVGRMIIAKYPTKDRLNLGGC